ncbi:hypothetical protein DFH09DRAFT_557679 [Mycena vulgaris]|nr:hypothetical protein DFH09DRAFT_557679 [Mycena vulgaris]
MSASSANCGSALQPSLPPKTELFALAHLLETNDPPLDVEIQTTRGIIADEEKRLRALDEKIAHLQDLLALCLQQRDDFKENIRRHSSIISPIRQLPAEILCKIFSFTLLPIDEMTWLMGGKSFNFGIGISPWVLTHICARWRSISLSFP